MNRLLALVTILSLGFSTSSQATDMISASAADRMGLEIAWERHLQVPAGAQSIVHQEIFVHSTEPVEYVEIHTAAKDAKGPPEVLYRIPTARVGKNGLPIGKPEAERLAGNEVRRLKRRGIEGTITSRVVPRVRLYTLGNDGTIECRDAESGEPVWMARIGNRRLGYSKFGVNDKFVAIVNGANLIKLDASNGEEMQSVRTTGAPLFGAVNSGRYALIPTIRNGVEGYPLDDPSEYPFHEMVEGIALAPPSKAPGTTRVAWGTDRGFVYVMELQGRPGVLFRLDTDGIVSGRLAAASGNRYFFGSDSGQVYGVLATRVGKVLWSKPYGEPFYNDPMVVGDQLMIRSTYGNLFSLGLVDGISNWSNPVPNVGELLAAFDGKIFVRLLTGGMAVLDQKTGEVKNIMHDVLPGRLLTNSQSDRLYLVSDAGSVQCLRPVGATLPTFNDTSEAPELTPKDSGPESPDADPDKMFAPPKDPFDPKAGGDPFAQPGTDPFGAGPTDPGADPFGGGADGGAAMDDPFGADPFGN